MLDREAFEACWHAHARRVTDARLVTRVPLSNGSVARVWHATTNGGACEIGHDR